MPGEIRVFGMGEQGVQVGAGPLHSETGDLMSAQNASFTGTDERGGVAKRMGLRAFTTSAAAGAVYAILSVTFADAAFTTNLTDMDLAQLYDDAMLALVEG